MNSHIVSGDSAAARSQSALSTSTSLLQRLRAEDPLAWNRFAELYTPLVYRWARDSGLQAADIADVTQEVFRIVSTKLNVYRRTDSRTSFRSWLWGITRNILRRHIHKLMRIPQAKGGSTAQLHFSQMPDILDSEEPPVDPEEGRSLMHRALTVIRGDFGESTWQAFWRMTVDLHSAREIGDDLGMSDRAVRQAKYRVLCRLRDELMD